MKKTTRRQGIVPPHQGWLAVFGIGALMLIAASASASYITTALKPLNVGLPTASTNAATKAYVDTALAANSIASITYRPDANRKCKLLTSYTTNYATAYNTYLPPRGSVLHWFCDNNSQFLCWVLASTYNSPLMFDMGAGTYHTVTSVGYCNSASTTMEVW